MIVGTLKNYIIHEESLGNFTLRIVGEDGKTSFNFEIEKDGKIIAKKKFKTPEDAEEFFLDMLEKSKNKKFNLNDKTARINSDNPKAFSPGSPSENKYTSEGPGGLLTHYPKKKKPFNRKNRQRTKWDESSGREDPNFQLSRVGPETGLGRDDGTDRTGFDEALRKEHDGQRPPIPLDEDSIDVSKNPDRYNPLYDNAYPGDRTTEQDIEQKRIDKSKQERQNEIRLKDQFDRYVIEYDDNGQQKIIKNLTFEEAISLSKGKMKSKILKQR